MMKIFRLQFCLMWLFMGLSFSAFSEESKWAEITFIDLQNLHVVTNEQETQNQVAAIKKNMDDAAQSGVDCYLIYAKDMMEALLTYDFEVDGIGNIGEQAYPPESKHRTEAVYLRKAFKEVCAYAKKKKIRLFFHTEQIDYPANVLTVIKPVTWGTSICPGRRAAWNVYAGKLNEFFTLFPDIDGLQISGDEAPYSVLLCQCDECSKLTTTDRINRLTKESATICQQVGKELQIRTWRKASGLNIENESPRMTKELPDGVLMATKNTLGDFQLLNPVDEQFLRAEDPKRLIVEFDAWREYEGHNYFPCYMGDVWAPRFALLKELGIQRVAVRLMWNSEKNPIASRVWGNYVNLYTFLEFAKNPQRNGDDILTEFVQKNFPAKSQKAAMELYKYSPEFQKGMYYPQDYYLANHSRVQDKNIVDDLKFLQDKGFFTKIGDFDQRIQDIDTLCNKANALVDRLGKEVPAEWKKGLKEGIEIEKYVAVLTTYKMQAVFMKEENAMQNFKKFSGEIEKLCQKWFAWHPESYASMNGDGVIKFVNKLAK